MRRIALGVVGGATLAAVLAAYAWLFELPPNVAVTWARFEMRNEGPAPAMVYAVQDGIRKSRLLRVPGGAGFARVYISEDCRYWRARLRRVEERRALRRRGRVVAVAHVPGRTRPMTDLLRERASPAQRATSQPLRLYNPHA